MTAFRNRPWIACIRHFAAAALLIALLPVANLFSDISEPDIASSASCTDKGLKGSLRVIMCDLGQNMNRIQSAIWLQNHEMLAVQAQQIADHPHVSQAERQRIRSALGNRFGEFVFYDKTVHSQSSKLASTASQHQEIRSLLQQFQQLQNGCINCHQAFRKELNTRH